MHACFFLRIDTYYLDRYIYGGNISEIGVDINLYMAHTATGRPWCEQRWSPSDPFCSGLNCSLQKNGESTSSFEAVSRGALSKAITFPGPREVASAKWAGPKFKSPAGATKEYLETLRCPADPKAKVGWLVRVRENLFSIYR